MIFRGGGGGDPNFDNSRASWGVGQGVDHTKPGQSWDPLYLQFRSSYSFIRRDNP